MLAYAAEAHPDGVNHTHYFTEPTHVGTKTEDGGKCRYVWGYDVNRMPIYHNDCNKTNIVWTYVYKCNSCETYQGNTWDKIVYVKLSINHD